MIKTLTWSEMQKLWTRLNGSRRTVNNSWPHIDKVLGVGSGQKFSILDLISLPTASLEVGSLSPF